MRTFFAILIAAGAAWAAGPATTAVGPPATAATPSAAGPTANAAAAAASTTASPLPEATADAGEVTLLSSGENGCTFEVRVPAPRATAMEGGGRRFQRYSLPLFRPTGDAGAPEMLVRTVRVAAPPGAEVSVAVERVSFDLRTGVKLYPRPRLEVEERRGERTLREVFTYDAAAYSRGPYPAKLAALDGQEIVRGYRLLSVAIYPYQYQPTKETLKVVQSIVVRVSFAGGVRGVRAGYPSRPAEEGIFSRVIPAVVLNWETAASWPFAGGLMPSSDGGVWPTDFAGKAAAKVVVEETGLYRVGYEELRAAGFPVDSVSPDNLRLFVGPAKRLPSDFYYEPEGLTELGCYVAGADDNSFDAGDYVAFYGHGCDFFEPTAPGNGGSQEFSKDMFTRYNVYWLVADDVAGKRMAPADVTPAGGTRPTYFWDRMRAEVDKIDKAESQPALGNEEEWWYWRDYYGPMPSAVMLTPPFVLQDPVASGDDSYFEVMVRRMPGYSRNGPHHTEIYLNYTDDEHKILDEIYNTDQELTLQERVPAALLSDGTNRLYVREVGDQSGTYDYVMLDRFEFEYPRRLRAYGDYLSFTNPPGVTGKVLFEVEGFSTDDLVLYDVTRGRRLSGFEVAAAGGEYTLRFTDDIPTGQCRYVAASAAAAAKEPMDVYLDAASTLRDIDEDVDLIVVAYDAYYDNVLPLVNFRRAQGLSVAFARMSDVFDEYSWGLFDPGAIRLFVKDLYRKALYRPGGRLPDNLLLVGDALTDYRDNNNKYPDRKLWRDFGLNQVPTYYIHDTTSGRSASDNYFVAMDNTLAPDLGVGRLAAPFDENIDAIVDKLLAYEREPPNGPWNTRVMLAADNNDKSPSGGGIGAFTRDNEDLETSFSPVGFERRKEYIEWLNRRYPPAGGGDYGFDGFSRSKRKRLVAEYMKPNFLKSFDALVFSYSGHGGPQIWSHEDLFGHHAHAPVVDDVYELENGPRFPIIIQCSCSTAYFDMKLAPGAGDPADYGQSISEYTLQEPRHGAVAMLGSTRLGTESTQNQFLQEFYKYLFPNRKVRDAGVTVGEVHLAAKINTGAAIIRDLFTLIGDPATTVAAPRPGITLTPDKGTVKLGETLTVTGTVPGNFSGEATVQLFDRPFYFYSADNAMDIYRDRLISTAEVEVVNGRFQATLMVPTVPVTPTGDGQVLAGETVAAAGAAGADTAAATDDITAAGGSGTAVAAAAAAGAGGGAPGPAVGYYESSWAPVAERGEVYVRAVAYGKGFRNTYVCDETVKVNVQGEVSSGDRDGPDVDIYLDDYSFRSGDAVGPTPTLLVDVRDESGVLVARNVEAIAKGEDTFVPLYVQVDDEPARDLTFYYSPALGDWRAGSAERKLALGEGMHTITVTAYDNLGNKRQKTVQCLVMGALAVMEVMNCPNPFADDTYFTFMASTDIDSLVIKIYTVTGRLIQKIEAGGLTAGYHQLYWDGRDGDGDRIANGVYFYKVVARAGDQRIVARQKLVKLR